MSPGPRLRGPQTSLLHRGVRRSSRQVSSFHALTDSERRGEKRREEKRSEREGRKGAVFASSPQISRTCRDLGSPGPASTQFPDLLSSRMDFVSLATHRSIDRESYISKMKMETNRTQTNSTKLKQTQTNSTKPNSNKPNSNIPNSTKQT